MRHGRTINHLGRRAEHRHALLSNLACSLIEHKRINTTVAKAKALRKYIEPLITKSKTDSTHNRRTVFSYLKNKEAVTELFRGVAPKIAGRPGGYVRIIRTGYRLGDNADTCLIELVDFNTIYGKDIAKAPAKKRTRRGGATKKGEVNTTATDESATATETSESEAKPKRAPRKKKDEDAAE
ncbi:MAG: 50S ribosomal protein L17 [Crocinitomicaceae bacterium]|nr:50S ribosomal protein L17 [Crocinitomicaceae bacterium]